MSNKKETLTEVWKRENRETWNAAIEAAIKFMVTNRLEEGLYDRMRQELKK